MDTSTPHTRTHDLGLAAALVSCGFGLHATERDENGRLCFVFRKTNETAEAIDAYWADTLDVKALTFSHSLKNLKNRIYAGE